MITATEGKFLCEIYIVPKGGFNWGLFFVIIIFFCSSTLLFLFFLFYCLIFKSFNFLPYSFVFSFLFEQFSPFSFASICPFMSHAQWFFVYHYHLPCFEQTNDLIMLWSRGWTKEFDSWPQRSVWDATTVQQYKSEASIFVSTFPFASSTWKQQKLVMALISFAYSLTKWQDVLWKTTIVLCVRTLITIIIIPACWTLPICKLFISQPLQKLLSCKHQLVK